MKYLFVGLGNPGAEYEGTRHNLGRGVLEAFRLNSNFPDWKFDKYANTLYSVGLIDEREIILAMPETFMNKSGDSVLYLKEKYDISYENILVVHDDIDLPLGLFKINFGRGSGGHNGVSNIIKVLGENKFVRLRIGIVQADSNGNMKKPSGEKKVIDFVLKKFLSEEKKIIQKEIIEIIKAIHVYLKEGYESAMNKFN